MAVMRVNKDKNFTVMSNHHLKNQNLSLKAKGLLSMMLSLPENWDYSIHGLCAICKENETAINSALKELINARYIIRTKIIPNKDAGERVIRYVYDIYEQPQEKEKHQPIDNQGVENLGVDFLGVENQGQLNTYEQSTYQQGTKEKHYHPTDDHSEYYSEPENKFPLTNRTFRDGVLSLARDVCIRKNVDSPSVERIGEVVDCFLGKYQEYMGCRHKNISRAAMERIVDIFVYPDDDLEYFLHNDCYPDLIDEHFKTKYRKQTDYSLSHFMSFGVIEMQARKLTLIESVKEW